MKKRQQRSKTSLIIITRTERMCLVIYQTKCTTSILISIQIIHIQFKSLWKCFKRSSTHRMRWQIGNYHYILACYQLYFYHQQGPNKNPFGFSVSNSQIVTHNFTTDFFKTIIITFCIPAGYIISKLKHILEHNICNLASFYRQLSGNVDFYPHFFFFHFCSKDCIT